MKEIEFNLIYIYIYTVDGNINLTHDRQNSRTNSGHNGMWLSISILKSTVCFFPQIRQAERGQDIFTNHEINNIYKEFTGIPTCIVRAN